MRTILFVLAMLAFAGCAAPAAVETASDPGATSAAQPATDVLAYDGVTPAYVEACAGAAVVGRCVDAPPMLDVSKMYYQPAVNGTPTLLTVTATWTAATPVNDEMTLLVQYRDANTVKTVGYKVGPSPLTLEVAKLEGKGKLTILLAGPDHEAGAPGAWAGANGSPADQPWKLAGNLTFTPR